MIADPDAKFPNAPITSRFVSSQDEEEVFHQDDLIRLRPFGVSMGTDSQRPFLLLKDEGQELTLPVAVSPIEAGVTLTQSNGGAAPAAVHRFSELLMNSLDIRPLQCVFVQVKGPHQYVRIYLSGHPRASSIRLRADEAMSLCLQLNIPMFATREFIQRSRTMAAELEELGKGLRQIPQIQKKRANTYMM